jgi:uncharacterized protein YceK
MRLVALLLIVSMMLSSCAYVNSALCVGASVPIFYASGKAISHKNKKETQDSVKQAIADSLKQEYPAMLQDSLSKKAADIAQKNRERELKQAAWRGGAVLLVFAGITAVVILLATPFRASPGLGD